ncbi:ECA polysaccharide chain length modulation protein [Escherichia coli]|nr:ECA polysaccharide chain length modulation protein [Escherichia coli]
MINNIVFIPGDFTRAVNDSVKLIAETAPDANNLLRQYVAFASQRAASHLNDELKGAWAARTIQMKAQVKRQEEVAKAIYDRRMNSEQALKIAEQHNISRSATMCLPRNYLIQKCSCLGVQCSRLDWKIYRPSVRPLISTMIRIGPC